MTRDEAVKIWRSSALSETAQRMLTKLRPDVVEAELNSMATADIDGFVGLGMLKLDEPKAFSMDRKQIERIDAAITEAGWDRMPDPVLKFCGLNIQQALHMAGLKIVEA